MGAQSHIAGLLFLFLQQKDKKDEAIYSPSILCATNRKTT
jgi:hypothetical protein